MENEQFCTLCGNEKTREADGIGSECRKLIEGQLARPYAFWKQCGEIYRKCCGRIASNKDGLYFHGKYMECSYPEKPKENEPSVSVEMGVKFGAAGAQTYYLRDFGNDTDSQPYGELIPYPSGSTDEMFWAQVGAQLDKAAEHAWNEDLLTCEHCGNHYISSVGCGCKESE